MAVDDWNWSNAAQRGDVVVETVRAIAVYANPKGDLVVRQEAFDSSDEDEFVVIPRAQVDAVIKAMRAATKV